MAKSAYSMPAMPKATAVKGPPAPAAPSGPQLGFKPRKTSPKMPKFNSMVKK